MIQIWLKDTEEWFDLYCYYHKKYVIFVRQWRLTIMADTFDIFITQHQLSSIQKYLLARGVEYNVRIRVIFVKYLLIISINTLRTIFLLSPIRLHPWISRVNQKIVISAKFEHSLETSFLSYMIHIYTFLKSKQTLLWDVIFGMASHTFNISL